MILLIHPSVCQTALLAPALALALALALAGASAVGGTRWSYSASGDGNCIVAGILGGFAALREAVGLALDWTLFLPPPAPCRKHAVSLSNKSITQIGQVYLQYLRSRPGQIIMVFDYAPLFGRLDARTNLEVGS